MTKVSDNEAVCTRNEAHRRRGPLSKVGRSHFVILKEEGAQHAPISFPYDMSESEIVLRIEAEGWKVLDHEITETPNDEKHIATIILKVRRK